MNRRTHRDPTDPQSCTAGRDALWCERWARLAAANEAARRKRLRALTLEGAMREFEDLCREVHAAMESPPVARSHPVGLVKYTTREPEGR